MMLTYGLTAIIVGSWIIKIIYEKRIDIKRTPLDIPLLIFLVSQIVSTIISLDRHVSFWGYYSRFNGGLLSTISYILLYFTFVSNFPKEKIKKLLKIALFSGLLVSIYGILEHLGIDKNIWVQDVQNRVFSTLGQPNWLAAYLAILIPISVAFWAWAWKDPVKELKKSSDRMLDALARTYPGAKSISSIFSPWALFGVSNVFFLTFYCLFFLTLLFTKSRSGFIGAGVAIVILSTLMLYISKKYIRSVVTLVSLSFLLVFLFESPFPQLNRFTLPRLTNNYQLSIDNQPPKPIGSSVIETGITESGTIRRIVWQGAIDIFRHYPLFGTGVETFAFSYYKFRPVEHNMTSEWDFLYNKAHNEYLNFAATTGSFGLGSYLLIIIIFIGWNLKIITKLKDTRYKQSTITNIQNKKNDHLVIGNYNLFGNCILVIGLFTGWLSILITNFFGFSVVIIQLFFFLIPAISYVLTSETVNNQQSTDNKQITTFQYFSISSVFFVICYMLYFLARLWYADVLFADGFHKVRSQEISPAYQSLKKALEINEEEPLYYDEFSYAAAEMAVAFHEEKQATYSAILAKEAIIASNFAVSHATQNVNFWKSRTRVFYVLSQIDEKYYADSLYSLLQTKDLSPTDPKIRYNLGLLYDKMGKNKEALTELEATTRLKPDYRDAFYALAYLYEKDNKRDKAKDALKYILTKIATDDAEVKKKLEEFK